MKYNVDFSIPKYQNNDKTLEHAKHDGSYSLAKIVYPLIEFNTIEKAPENDLDFTKVNYQSSIYAYRESDMEVILRYLKDAEDLLTKDPIEAKKSLRVAISGLTR